MLKGRQNRTLYLYVVTATNLDLIQSQRRDVAQRAGGPGGGYMRRGAQWKVFIWDGEILKTTTDGTPLYSIAITVPLLSTYMIQYGYIAFNNIP